jgi:Skp family chaperone for outer membrane proteins
MKTHPLILKLMSLAALAGVVAGPVALRAQAAEVKAGSVALAKLYDEFYKTKIARRTFEDSVAAYRKDRTQRIEDFNKLNEEYQKLREESGSQALTQEKRDLKSKAAQEKLLELRKSQQAIQDFEQSSQQFLGDQQRRQTSQIMREVLEAVRKRAKDGGYTFVVDTSGVGSGGIPGAVYADEKLDFTDLVLKDLNANAPANLPSSSGTGTNTPSLTPLTPAPTPPPPPAR